MQVSQQPNSENISTLLELDHAIRRAESLQSLLFVIVNQTNRLVPFDQAVFLAATENKKNAKVRAISNIAAVDRSSPFVHWVEKIARKENRKSTRMTCHPLSQDDMTEDELADWNDFSPPHVLWLPLVAPLQGYVGTLWLSRGTPWSEKELVLLDHLALSYAHALQVFLRPYRFSQLMQKFFNKPVLLILSCIIVAVMAIPVHLTALAPAEIVPIDPYIISSPMNGMVKKLLVQSNEQVVTGQPLVLFDDTELANNEAIATEALKVAQVQREKAARGAFASAQNREILAELTAQVDLRRAELDFAGELLKRSLLVSEMNGVAIVTQADAWAGHPVHIGEKILQIADPGQVQLKIMLPVADATVLAKGSRVRIFLDSAPLDPEEAQVMRAEYEAYQTEAGIVSYRIIAKFLDPSYHPRIGLRGTAKLFGKKVTIFYYLFRRPITAVRQWIGW